MNSDQYAKDSNDKPKCLVGVVTSAAHPKENFRCAYIPMECLLNSLYLSLQIKHHKNCLIDNVACTLTAWQ
jgi:hypothetical protein